MSYLPTLYKARGVPLKQPVCAICIDRTRGKTRRVEFGYGVVVWLCAGHAGPGFLAGRSGRDVVLTLMRTWQANGCYTRNRQKALTAHLAGLRAKPARARPGSYAWPELRLRVEALCARGGSHGEVERVVQKARFGVTRPPSARTLRRWRAERRWAGGAAAAARPP